MNFPPFFLTLGGVQPALVNACLAAPIFLPFSAGTTQLRSSSAL